MVVSESISERERERENIINSFTSIGIFCVSIHFSFRSRSRSHSSDHIIIIIIIRSLDMTLTIQQQKHTQQHAYKHNFELATCKKIFSQIYLLWIAPRRRCRYVVVNEMSLLLVFLSFFFSCLNLHQIFLINFFEGVLFRRREIQTLNLKCFSPRFAYFIYLFFLI